MTEQQLRKRHIRFFIQNHYTDERLAMLLAHARDGKLAYNSCCCFVGAATADHALRLELSFGNIGLGLGEPHYQLARSLPGSLDAEEAFGCIARLGSYSERDEARRRILIPMIRAEMRRRERRRPVAREELSHAGHV